MYFFSYFFTRFSSNETTPSLQGFTDDGLDHLMQSLTKKGLSKDVITRLLKDVEDQSIKKYQTYWFKFSGWCNQRKISPGSLSVNNLCKFLIFMFDSGLSASSLKFIRSSLYFFLRESHCEIIESPIISRLLKSFEKL